MDLPSAEDVRGILKDVKTEDPPAAFYESKLGVGTALAPIVEPAPAEWERCLEPRSMQDARILAKSLHDSHMFNEYGKAHGVLRDHPSWARTRDASDGLAT